MYSSEDFLWDEVGYWRKENFLRENYEKVEPLDFYRDLFPEGSLRESYSGSEDGMACAIVSYKCEEADYHKIKSLIPKNSTQKVHVPAEYSYFSHIINGNCDYIEKIDKLDANFSAGAYYKPGKPIESCYTSSLIVHDNLEELKVGLGKMTARVAPIDYFGRAHSSKNAHTLYSITLDLDYVGFYHLDNLLGWFKNNGYLTPTYLVHSGRGVHLYFVLDEPIPMYDYVKAPLDDFKNKLIDQLWNKFTSGVPDKVDAQSWSSQFRMVGSASKLGADYPVTAYKIGRKIMLSELNDMLYRGDRLKLPLTSYRPTGRTGKSIEECKELYPEWYERITTRGKKSPKQTRESFTMHRGVYDSWLVRIKDGKKVGTRYHCMSMLFAAAIKCDIPYDEVYADALDLMADFDSIGKDSTQRFTHRDLDSASLYYKDCFRNISLNAIEFKTKIILPRNRRNGRTQTDHCKVMRAIQGVTNPNWREGNGRPSAEGTVRDYLKANPTAKKCEVIKNTGLTKPTVYKYYDKIMEELKM